MKQNYLSQQDEEYDVFWRSKTNLRSWWCCLSGQEEESLQNSDLNNIGRSQFTSRLCSKNVWLSMTCLALELHFSWEMARQVEAMSPVAINKGGRFVPQWERSLYILRSADRAICLDMFWWAGHSWEEYAALWVGLNGLISSSPTFQLLVFPQVISLNLSFLIANCKNDTNLQYNFFLFFSFLCRPCISRYPLKLLVGMQTSTATMENSVEIP